MDKPADTQEHFPRIVPTPSHSQALRGQWSLDGRVVRMDQEPGTGVLVAVNEDGRMVNPMVVISHGKKIQDSARSFRNSPS